ncbi:MAG: hypothetical protein K9J17_11235 [Flavobacteriales bacterium]|nr:hypothetical protein [Flavobacteriales bacterium]
MKTVLKTLVFLIFLVTYSATSSAQKIKLKNDKVLIDGRELFRFEKGNHPGWISLFSLETDEELIMIKQDHGGTPGPDYRDDDYTIYTFLKEDIKAEISSYNLWQNNIKFLLEQRVFDENGVMNADRIKSFKVKFDEDITSRRIRID